MLVVMTTGCGRIAFGPIDATDARTGETADGRTVGDGAVATIPNLVLWYSFDESSFSGFALDHAGNHDADCTGSECPAAIAGRVAGAAAFDGVSQFLSTADSPGLSTQASLTIAAFAWPASLGTNASIVAKAHDDSATANSWQLEIVDTGEVRFKTRGAALADESVVGPLATAGAWQHVAGTWDGATLRLYVNGVDVGNMPMPDLVFDDNPILVGADENGGAPAGFFPGRIDDVRLYDRALTPAEVLQLASQ
jgi:hypothetical protein